MYFDCITCPKKESSNAMILHSCLANKALLVQLADLIPKPPSSIGEKRVSLLTRCILLEVSDCHQKKFIHLELIPSHIFCGRAIEDMM